MEDVHVPVDELELLAILRLLEAEGIPYHVHNEYFASLYPGQVGVDGVNARRLLVPYAHADAARALIAAHLGHDSELRA